MSEQRFNPNEHLTRVSGGADYLEVKWRVYWLRTEHPDAIIETEMTTIDTQLAVFRARVTIPGGGSSTGWGSETQGDFRDFIEKAETKALGRALASLGFGTQFCGDFDYGADQNRVVDSPVNFQEQLNRKPRGHQGRVEPRAAASDPPVDQQAIAGLHARAGAVGIGHEQLHDYVVKRFPITSVKDLTGRMLFELNKAIDAGEVGKASDVTAAPSFSAPVPAPAIPAHADDPSAKSATPKQLQFISSIARELNISDASLHLESQASFGCEISELNRRDASILIERLQQRRMQTMRPTGATV